MRLKKLFFCIVTLLCLQANFTTQPYTADVETFFLPQSQADIYKRLSSFLDRAKSRVLIAMYWFLDEVIFNKLVELKKRGIDIQIIFDESTTNAINHLVAFSRNNIIAIMSPKGINGIMHNKFVVIDSSAVWTGSANFTQIVFKPEGKSFNDENIVIINSPIAAEQYSNAFYSIEKGIFEYYLQCIAKQSSKELPDWIIPLCQWHYQVNKYFKETIHESLPSFNDFEQAKLISLFPEEHPKTSQMDVSREEEEATPKQKYILEKHGVNPNISKREAFDIIGKIIESEKSQRYLPYKGSIHEKY